MSRRPIPASIMVRNACADLAIETCAWSVPHARASQRTSTHDSSASRTGQRPCARVLAEAIRPWRTIRVHDRHRVSAEPHARRPRHARSPSSWRAACARRRAHRAGNRRAPRRRCREWTRVEAAPNGYLNVFLDRPAFLLSRLGVAGTLPAPAARAGQDHRRAHGDQSEQGRAHRPPAQLRARRHARPRAALPRQPGRSAELHRRHRRAGGRRRRRLPRARAA